MKLLEYLFPPKLPKLDKNKAMPQVLGYHNRINRNGVEPPGTDAVRIVSVTEHAPAKNKELRELRFFTVSGK